VEITLRFFAGSVLFGVFAHVSALVYGFRHGQTIVITLGMLVLLACLGAAGGALVAADAVIGTRHSRLFGWTRYRWNRERRTLGSLRISMLPPGFRYESSRLTEASIVRVENGNLVARAGDSREIVTCASDNMHPTELDDLAAWLNDHLTSWKAVDSPYR
jgi:hypothetical protein